jgi:sugar porter (SP) family MFS transporter
MANKEQDLAASSAAANVQFGDVIDVQPPKLVSRLVPRNNKVLQSLFYVTAFIQAYQQGYDASVMNGLNILPSYTEYFTLTTASLSLNTAALWVGGILSGFVSGQFCDWAGRKKTMFWSSIMCLIGAVIQGCAQNVGMFVAARIIIGFGLGFAAVGCSTYLAEAVSVQSRAFILGFFWDAWWAGSLIAAGITFCTKSLLTAWAWRAPSILQGLPSLLCIAILPFLPESPRWLIYQDRADEALEVLAVTHGNGDASNQVVVVEYTENTETLRFEKVTGSVSPLEVLRTSGNRKRIILCLSVGIFSMTMGNNVVTYYLGTMLNVAGVTDFDTQLIVNIVLSGWAFVSSLVGTAFMNSLGRRALALISTALGTIFLFLVGGFSALYGDGTNISGSYATIAMIFLFLGAYSVGWTPLSMLYPAEVLNYSTRATGMAMFTFLSNGIGLMITFAFPYSFEAIGWKTYMINAAFNVLAFIFVWLLWVETKGKSLEEMDEMMDGVKHADVPNVMEVATGKISV